MGLAAVDNAYDGDNDFVVASLAQHAVVANAGPSHRSPFRPPFSAVPRYGASLRRSMAAATGVRPGLATRPDSFRGLSLIRTGKLTPHPGPNGVPHRSIAKPGDGNREVVEVLEEC